MLLSEISSLERKRLARIKGYRRAKVFAAKYGCYRYRAAAGYCGHLAVATLLRVPVQQIIQLKPAKWTGHTDIIRFGNALNMPITTEQMQFTGRRVEAWTVGKGGEHYIFIEGFGRNAQVIDNFVTAPFGVWVRVWGGRRNPPQRMAELPLVLQSERTTVTEYNPSDDPFV